MVTTQTENIETYRPDFFCAVWQWQWHIAVVQWQWWMAAVQCGSGECQLYTVAVAVVDDSGAVWQ